MNKLTSEQKKIIASLLHYESKFNDKIDEDAYGNSPAYRMLDRWLSEILDLDFRKDIYDNQQVQDLNKIEQVKNQFVSTYSQWFVGDAIMDIIYDLSRNTYNTEDQIFNAENNIKDCWEFFLDLTPKAKSKDEEEFIFVDSGVNLNGEQLYKKVKK